MKPSIYRKTLMTLLVGATVSCSAPLLAAEGFSSVSLPDEAVFDTSDQLKEGISAYQRGNYDEAFRVFRNIAIFGQPEVHYRLGLMYAEGLGTRKSPTLAAHWLKLAAKHNYPGASEALISLRSAGISG